MDVSKPCIDSIWVSIVDVVSKVQSVGFWVHVLYDFIPLYCRACWHIGHGRDHCKLPLADQVLEEFPLSDKLPAAVDSATNVDQCPVKSPYQLSFASQSLTLPLGLEQLQPANNFQVDKAGLFSQNSLHGASSLGSCALQVTTGNSFCPLERVSEEGPVCYPSQLTKASLQNVVLPTVSSVADGNSPKGKGNCDAKVSTGAAKLIALSACGSSQFEGNECLSGRELSKPLNVVQIEEQGSIPFKPSICLGMSSGSSPTKHSQVVTAVGKVLEKCRPTGSDLMEVVGSKENIAHQRQVPTNHTEPKHPAHSPQRYVVVDGVVIKSCSDDMAEDSKVRKMQNKSIPTQQRQEYNGVGKSKEQVGLMFITKGTDKKYKPKMARQVDSSRLICQDDSLYKGDQFLDYKEEGLRLITRRSLSPTGRASPKLKSLRYKVDTIKIGAERSELVELQDYEEIYQADVERIRKAKKGRSGSNPTGLTGIGQTRPRRIRGRNRNFVTPNKPRYRGPGHY